MDANNQLPNRPPLLAILLIKIISFIWITPIFTIVWTYATLKTIWYIIFSSSNEKRFHKKLLMEAHNIPPFSNFKLSWYKALSIIEKFQKVEFKKIMFLSMCIWIELIVLYIKYF